MLCMNFFGYILVTSWIKPLHWSQVLCTIVVSRVFNRRKGFRAFSQPASVPRKRLFPESIVEFSPSSVYPFVKAKTCFHTGVYVKKLFSNFFSQRKLLMIQIFYLILDFNKETLSEFPARLVSFFI